MFCILLLVFFGLGFTFVPKSKGHSVSQLSVCGVLHTVLMLVVQFLWSSDQQVMMTLLPVPAMPHLPHCCHIGTAARSPAMQPHWQATRRRAATCLLCHILYKDTVTAGVVYHAALKSRSSSQS